MKTIDFSCALKSFCAFYYKIHPGDVCTIFFIFYNVSKKKCNKLSVSPGNLLQLDDYKKMLLGTKANKIMAKM